MDKTIQPLLNARERFIEPGAGKAFAKSSGLKLLLAGVPRLGDLLFAFPAIDVLLHCGMVKNLSVLCYRYVAPLLAGVNGKAGHVTLPERSWNIFNRWRMVRCINQQKFDLAMVFNGKRSARELLAATNIPAILIEQPTGGLKATQHLHTVIKAFPQDNAAAGPAVAIPSLRITKESLDWAQSMLSGIERPIIAFHVGCQRVSRRHLSFEQINRSATKVWLVERYLELGQMIIDQLAATVLMVGSGSSERFLAEEFVERLGPRCKSAVDWGDCMQTAALLKHCRALIASDSGVLHLAAAVGLKAVALWGPTPIEMYAPSAAPGTIKIMHKHVDCSPCRKRQCGNKICLSSISAKEVFEALLELTADNRPHCCAITG